MGDHLLAWSGGKDAAFALMELLSMEPRLDGLWTTVNESNERSSMHGVRRSLYERQASAIGLPIRFVELPEMVDNETYRSYIHDDLTGDGTNVASLAYADIHLEGVRQYREETLTSIDVTGRWPIWGIDTADLMDRLLDAGFTAHVVAVDASALDPCFLGRQIDHRFLDELPETVDPAGEGGEYHTFVSDGPPFDHPVEFTAGETVERTVGETTMHYLDLIPA